MKYTIATLLTTLCCANLVAQAPQFYMNDNGQKHYIGSIELPLTSSDTVWSDWEVEGDYTFDSTPKWASELESVRVTIFLGTWCGDSKQWVPEFLGLWESLGLSTDQIQLIGLYDGQEKYKRGPDNEETGRMIHRVPTFIFERAGIEIGRIVETPLNDLVTDVAQIAAGMPSEPNYRVANDIMKIVETEGVEGLRASINGKLYEWFDQVHKPNELNTLGYVYLRAGRIEEALTVFYINTLFFRYNPMVWESYAEAYAKSGDPKRAIYYYMKALDINPDLEEAREALKELLNEETTEGND